MNRADMIQWFVDYLDAKTYLEIGVRFGKTFFQVQCENKIGVDIEINHMFEGVPNIFEMTSDEFFKEHAVEFDVAFIDGDHTYEQSLRDVENCLKWMNPKGAIILHDCNPQSPESAAPSVVPGFPDWSGEVWKTVVNLRTRPDLFVCVMDADCGLGLVMKDAQTVLDIPVESIAGMTYQDLKKNRKSFLNLLEVSSG